MELLTRILLDVLGPILLLIGVGAVVRWRFKVDIATLSKLNIYVFVPGFVYYYVSTSTLEWGQMGSVVGVTALNVLVLGLLVWGIGTAARVESRLLATLALSTMFYNSGNYGLPLAMLAFPGTDAAAVQTFVLLTQNILTFTVGLTIAAYAGSGSVGKGFVTIFRLPIIPTLVAAFATKWWLEQNPSRQLPVIIAKPVEYIAMGLVPIALITLGAQLAKSPRWPRWKPVAMVMVLRLVVSGCLMAGYLAAIRALWPNSALAEIPPQWLILTATTPSAINTLLLTLELGGDADMGADCVFWTTVFSIVSVAIWLAILTG